MIEYHVMLRRHKGSARPDVCVFRDSDRKTALREMRKYYRENGFTVHDRDGRFTIADITLVEREPIVGAPVISETPYYKLFNAFDEPLKEECE